MYICKFDFLQTEQNVSCIFIGDQVWFHIKLYFSSHTKEIRMHLEINLRKHISFCTVFMFVECSNFCCFYGDILSIYFSLLKINLRKYLTKEEINEIKTILPLTLFIRFIPGSVTMTVFTIVMW